MGYARTGWLNEEWDTLSRCLMGITSTHSCGDLNIGGGRLCLSPVHHTPVPKLAYINISSAFIGTFFVVVFDVWLQRRHRRIVYFRTKKN